MHIIGSTYYDYICSYVQYDYTTFLSSKIDLSYHTVNNCKYITIHLQYNYMSRRRTNTNTRSMNFPKAALNFVSTVLLAMIFIAITDNIQPNLIQYVSARQQSTHPQPHQPPRSLRGSRSQHQKASTASSQIPKHIPDFEGEDKLIRHLNASSTSTRIYSKSRSSCAHHNNNAEHVTPK